jgi:hypothetical protein
VDGAASIWSELRVPLSCSSFERFTWAAMASGALVFASLGTQRRASKGQADLLERSEAQIA